MGWNHLKGSGRYGYPKRKTYSRSSRRTRARLPSRAKAAGLKRAAPRRGTRRRAKPLVLTRPLARAVDLHTKQRKTAHHAEFTTIQKLQPDAAASHGIFVCTPGIYQVGQVIPSTGLIQQDNICSREGNAVRVRSWKISINIEQLKYVTQLTDPSGAAGVEFPCRNQYEFNIWIAYNKLAVNYLDAANLWQPSTTPPHVGYVNSAWRVMSGLHSEAMPLNDPYRAPFSRPTASR